MIGARLVRRWRLLFRRSDAERMMDSEMRHHIDCEIEERTRAGLPEAEARRTALRDFGGVERFKEEARDARGGRLLDDTIADLRHAFRSLRSTPAFTGAAIVSLALGIGANVALFTLIQAVLLRPLPFPDAGNLYRVWSANHGAGADRAWTSPLTFADWRVQRHQVADLGGYFYMSGGTGINLVGGEPQHLSVAFVTEGFFSTLEAPPLLGRLPRPDELTRGGSNHIVVLSWPLWQQRFGGSRAVIDSVVTLNSGSYQVIGVMPRSLQFPNAQVDVYIPYGSLTDEMVPWRRDVHTLSLVARGRTGVPAASVRAELRGIAQRTARGHPEDAGWDDATVMPLQQVVTDAVRPRLLVLGGAVAFLLLMACVNLAALQLARAARRHGEIAIRVALGASRWRVMRQLVTESLVVAITGAVASVAIAMIAMRLLSAAILSDAPMQPEIRFSLLSAAVALLLALVTTVGFGVLPAMRDAAADPHTALRTAGRGTSGSVRLRSGLVISEIALAFVLVTGAGLMVRTFAKLSSEPLGFNGDHLVAASISVDMARHPDSAFFEYYDQLLARLRHTPGLQSVAAVRSPPLQGQSDEVAFLPPGMPPRPAAELPTAPIQPVSDGYFATIGARVLDGREFVAGDRQDTPAVALVNHAFVAKYLAAERAVNGTLLLGGSAPVRVVGVVADLRQGGLDQPPEPTIYVPYLQSARAQVTFVAKSAAPLAALSAMRRAIVAVDPQQAMGNMATFDELRGSALAQPRTIMLLLLVFGAVGLSLGVTGVYGVLAYLVAGRRREIGVRMAIGAQRHNVIGLVLRRGMLLSVLGVMAGAVAAVAATRALRTVIFGVTPTDPITFVVAGTVLLLASALAAWVPARRAARISPLDAIRE